MQPSASTSSLSRRPSFSAAQQKSLHCDSSLNGKGKQKESETGPMDAETGSEKQAEATPTVWEVTLRSVQTKKNKTWEQDGILIVRGTSATLRDEQGKSLGTSTITGPLFEDDEIKVGSKEVLIMSPMLYSTFLSRFNYASSSHIAPTPALSMQPINPSRSRPPSLPPATLAQKIARSGVPKAGPSQGFKPLRPMSQSISQRRPSIGACTPMRRENENRAPSGSTTAGTDTGKGKEKWEMEVLIDGSSPVVARKDSVEKKRTRVIESEDEEEGEEGGPPKKISPIVGRQDRIKPVVQMLELVDDDGDDDDDDVDVQVMPPPKVKVAVNLASGSGSKFKALTSSVGAGKSQADRDETHYYLCFWRKQSTKKHATWEGDGVLIIAGKRAVLKDRDTGKDIASSSCSGAKLMPGDPVQVGQKVCEIESILPAASYIDGSIFMKVVANPLMSAVASTSFFTAPPLLKPKAFNDPVTGGKLGANKTPQPRWDPAEKGAVVMKRPDEEHERIWNKKNLPIVDVVIDPLLTKALREHQKEGIKFLYECVMGMRSEGQGCILADEMGLGKTIQAISLIWTLLKQSPYWGAGTGVIERAIIVCPVTLVKNWANEIRKWLGKDRLKVCVAGEGSTVKSFCLGKSYQVLIIGYEKLRTAVNELKSIQPPIGLVICDEGHRLKSSGAKVTQALNTLACQRRIILSGTPIQNDLSEYHTMVDFVNPKCLDTYATFKKVFEKPIVRSRDPKATPEEKELGTARSDQLARISQSFMLRRTGDVISKFLPPKLEYTVFIMPTETQLAIYAKILEGSAVRDVLAGQAGGNAQQLSLLNMLTKLCNTPGLLMQSVKAGKGLEILRGSVVDLLDKAGSNPFDFGLSGKMLALGSMLQECRKLEEKIVVVSNFTSTLDIIEKHCKQNKYPFCRLDGKTDQKDRMNMVNSFNRGPIKTNFIFLLSSKSGGTGLNIIGASRLVLIDSDWNPSTDLQAMARIHREGQKKQCVIYRFLTSGTMDEKIFQRQTTKLGLSGSLMDNESMGGASKGGDAFTISDLRNIFKHHPGSACQTHELLGCRCHFDETPAAVNEAEEEEEEEAEEAEIEMGFTQASQYKFEEPKPSKERKNLSVLMSWAHHNGSDQQSVDEIEDELLKAVVYDRVVEATDEEGWDPIGNGGMRLRGGQIGMCFARKSSGEVEAQ